MIRTAGLADIPDLMRIRLGVRENSFNPARVSPADVVWFVENAPVWVWEEAGHRTATLDTEPGTRAAEFYRRQGWVEGGLDAAGELLFSRVLVTAP